MAKHRIAVLLALLAAGSGVGVADTSAPPLPNNAWAIVQRMAERNPSLESYRARVHVDIRMLNFPFLAPKLDGTSYFRRPDTYVVVFDRMPSYARGFQRLFDDIGNPKAWENFSQMAPSHRHQYILWIKMAKREETRDKRLKEAIQMIMKKQQLGLK